MLSKVIFIALSFGLVVCDSTYCPPTSYISPCTCQNNWITCGGDEPLDLDSIFNALSGGLETGQKTMQGFTLSNTAITELKANQFRDIIFFQIRILGASSLHMIDGNAFTGTEKQTIELVIEGSHRLSQSAEKSLFTAVKKFVAIEFIHLLDNGITEIPNTAFYKHPKLTHIRITGPSIKKLGSMAFKYLDALKELAIQDTSLTHIPNNAFEFIYSSNTKVSLNLYNNPLLSTSSFALYSLDYVKKPAQLMVGIDRKKYPKSAARSAFPYLAMDPFWWFLYHTKDSSIDIRGHQLDCNDCRNYWIKEQKYESKIIGLACSNGKPFDDSSNFAGCSRRKKNHLGHFLRPMV